MTGRERELATIRHEVPDRIPLDAICIETIPQIAAHLGVAEGEVYGRLGIDGRLVSAPYTGPLRYRPDGAPLTEWGSDPACHYGVDRWYPFGDDATVADVERYPLPDPERFDYGAAALAARGMLDHAVRGPYWLPVFCRVCDLLGAEEALVALRLRPGVFEALVTRIVEANCAYCERLLDTCGDSMDIFCIGDDFATQRGMMLDPVLWRRYLKPAYAQLFSIGKRHGKPVWFHSCGDVTAVLPDLVDIGMDVWETVQLHALPLTAADLKREYGRHITFFGGISTQRLPFCSPGEVSAEVAAVITALGRGGGYICGPDHHIKPDAPPANTVALFETGREFRADGWTTG